MHSLAFLILRLVFGLGFAVHGYQALFVMDGAMEMMSEMIATWGWPAPEAWAYLAKITELIGGVLVALGFLTRAASLACAGAMGVAIWMVHLDHPFNDLDGGPGWEMAALYLAVFLCLLLTGGGKLSIDGFRKDRVPESSGPPATNLPPFEVSKPASRPEVPGNRLVVTGDAVWDGGDEN
jgi:putative oxidoreductase